LVLAASVGGSRASRPAATCEPSVGPFYSAKVQRALRSGRDVWGNRLLHRPGGPTYERMRHLLPPLLFAGAPSRQRKQFLPTSRVYYLPFGWPGGGFGANSIALHVADGSEIVAERADGPRLTISVGEKHLSPYGSCVTRLATPQLYGGYLPILETKYEDAA